MSRVKLLSVLVLAALTGCGPAPIPTVGISGTVTLDNAPVKDAAIIFFPDKAGDATVSAEIRDGKFNVPVIPQGTYKAAIRSHAIDTSNKAVDSTFGAPGKNAKPDLIPAKYREPTIPVDATTANDAIKITLKS